MQSNPSLRPTNFSGFKRLIALATALLLVPMTSASLFAQQQPYYPAPQQPYPYSDQYDPGQQYQQPYAAQPSEYAQPQPGYQQSQGLGPDQLQQLIAPIALNPDPLVALMLAASTYPQQVSDADHWRQSQGNAPPDQIAYGADQQNWDPSVKALTAFPQVLAEMDQNIQWTAALGNAYYNQPQAVLQSIQIMRQRAQSAGNLQSTPQEDVSYNQGYIQLAPANPQVIYVPSYNPWTVYGQPVSPYPGFSLLGALGGFFNSSFGSSAIQYGLGIVMSAFNHSPWGLLSWGLNWLTQNLLFHHSDYYSSSPSMADWGLRYGGPRAWMAPHRSLVGYNRGYGRNNGRSYNQSYNRSAGQSFIRSRNRYSENWSRNNDNRNYQNRYQSSGYGNRIGYRTNLYNRPQSPFANRASSSYNRSFNASNRYGSGNGSSLRYNSGSYHAPDNRAFNQRSLERGNAYRSSSFLGARNSSSRSGGFHLFGGGHNSSSFGHQKSFSYKAPKYKAPKGFGGGHHSFGGGHSFSHSSGHGGGGHGGGHHSGGHHR